MLVYISAYVSTNASANRNHMNVDCSNTVAVGLPQVRCNAQLTITGMKKMGPT